MTTGLDPQARRDAWALIEGVRDRGVTIVLRGQAFLLVGVAGWSPGHGAGTSPASYAKTTSWVRSRAPNLVRIRLTCVLTVGRLTCSVSASSVFDKPRARRERTSRSRSVSCSRSRRLSGGTGWPG